MAKQLFVTFYLWVMFLYDWDLVAGDHAWHAIIKYQRSQIQLFMGSLWLRIWIDTHPRHCKNLSWHD